VQSDHQRDSTPYAGIDERADDAAIFFDCDAEFAADEISGKENNFRANCMMIFLILVFEIPILFLRDKCNIQNTSI
jgi:hypothetical protein